MKLTSLQDPVFGISLPSSIVDRLFHELQVSGSLRNSHAATSSIGSSNAYSRAGAAAPESYSDDASLRAEERRLNDTSTDTEQDSVNAVSDPGPLLLQYTGSWSSIVEDRGLGDDSIDTKQAASQKVSRPPIGPDSDYNDLYSTRVASIGRRRQRWLDEYRLYRSPARKPEAAAAYPLNTKTYVVCDAGGGTVDLLEYKSSRVEKKRPGRYDIHSSAMTKQTQYQAETPGVYEEPAINGHLQGADVSAFPDTGAAANFISLSYAQRHRLTVDRDFCKRVKVGDGSTIRVVGTTTLPFSFAGETTPYELTFHVLRKSLHDVILGSTFLRVSETFTRFAHRVGRKIRESVGRGIHRLCFLGSQQYVNGIANNVRVDAVPDTGADVSVMSTRFANANGFEIDDDEQHRILLGFADGSTARARGVVKNVAWSFGADEKAHLTNVYVLSSLPVDLVLGYDFLCQTEAFIQHEHDFWHVEDLEQKDFWMLCLIRVLKRALKGVEGDDSREYPRDFQLSEESMSDNVTANAAEQRWQLAKAYEVELYRKAREEAQDLGLPDDEKVRYLQPHVDRWRRFMATKPDHCTHIVSMTPPYMGSGSAASSQAGEAQFQVHSHVQPIDQSIPLERFSVGWFRRKVRGRFAVPIADRS